MEDDYKFPYKTEEEIAAMSKLEMVTYCNDLSKEISRLVKLIFREPS